MLRLGYGLGLVLMLLMNGVGQTPTQDDILCCCRLPCAELEVCVAAAMPVWGMQVVRYPGWCACKQHARQRQIHSAALVVTNQQVQNGCSLLQCY